MSVFYDGNRVDVSGELTADDALRLLSAIHNITKVKGYQDIILDFTNCTRAYSPEMMGLCARSLACWKLGVDVELLMPSDEGLARLFKNANWAHLIDFRNYEESRFRGYTHAPAVRFKDGQEQVKAVDRILDILLAAISHFGRGELRYIEWAINEITDNVINHSKSPIGGIVQVTNHRQREWIELVVADAGIGIPSSLRPSHPEIKTDAEALHSAIQEGVTRDRNIGQGNGLYGTWSICQKSDGHFSIRSGNALLNSPSRGEVTSSHKSVPIMGSIVVAKIGYSSKFDLSKALVFSGKTHIPVDYIETHFHEDENGNTTFPIKSESQGFGSRALGDPVRRKLVNVLNCMAGGKLIIDFSEVNLVSSSYADEVIGKLFVELGPINFMSKVQLANVDPLVQSLIDRAITQRVQVGLST